MNLIFVSSPQKEFKHIRKKLCYFILTDLYLKQYFDVFLFENFPANKRNPRNNYRSKVKECKIYLGLFGKTYGPTNSNGISATEDEYNYATKLSKDSIIYLKVLKSRDKQSRKMAILIRKVKNEITYDTFKSFEELQRKVLQSLLYWQQ